MNDDTISRQAAIDAAIDGADEWDGGSNITRSTYISDAISAIPAADVRPVVLCRECKRRELCRTTTIWAVPPKDDWFCADGERRGADMRPEGGADNDQR